MDKIIPAASGQVSPYLSHEAQAARDFAVADKSAATRRAYKSDFSAFQAWCEQRGLASMPSAPDAIAVYIASLATSGRRPSTIQRAIAAIRYAHSLAGHELPTASERVKVVMRGIRKTVGAAKVQKTAATSPCLVSLLNACPDSLKGKRDRAILALGFAGAFRRSELVALNVEDLTETADGFRVMIRASKTDQAGEGQVVAIPTGHRIRPVEAVQAWLQAAGITTGPIFRSVGKSGRLGAGMTAQSVALVIKQYAEAAGFDPAGFAGHSLRAGFLTSAAEHGATIFKMMEVSRHRSIDTLQGYVRAADAFKNHAGASFL
jgi:site-specific recombinase XerD